MYLCRERARQTKNWYYSYVLCACECGCGWARCRRWRLCPLEPCKLLGRSSQWANGNAVGPKRQGRVSHTNKHAGHDPGRGRLLRTSSSPHTVICCSYSSATSTSAEQFRIVLFCDLCALLPVSSYVIPCTHSL
ncbi:hypothetical protein HDV57DRAFT_470279 [Trichoderma longibrachiatum]|uniref:Uncharacterized protein n=1 Tax=Trichoderma longibrachiatum ATCC 18648 TaxID=983965 RepID=A0A2T4C5Z7_TRILO|nr:hypothetical protein M440DRAFT_307537 [Trichoderma longibrachiatum ATCC 18648]